MHPAPRAQMTTPFLAHTVFVAADLVVKTPPGPLLSLGFKR
jgi:hypothetical protein